MFTAGDAAAAAVGGSLWQCYAYFSKGTLTKKILWKAERTLNGSSYFGVEKTFPVQIWTVKIFFNFLKKMETYSKIGGIKTQTNKSQNSLN